jgi:hypothetical protein
MAVGGIHFSRHAIVAVNTLMHQRSSIDGQMPVMADAPHTFDVVSVVMRYQKMMHLRKTYAIVSEIFLQGTHTNTGIDHDSVGIGIDIVAVSTASTAKRNKSQHQFVLFECKDNKKIGDEEQKLVVISLT